MKQTGGCIPARATAYFEPNTEREVVNVTRKSEIAICECQNAISKELLSKSVGSEEACVEGNDHLTISELHCDKGGWCTSGTQMRSGSALRLITWWSGVMNASVLLLGPNLQLR